MWSKKKVLVAGVCLACVLGGVGVCTNKTTRGLALKVINNPDKVVDVLAEGDLLTLPQRVKSQIDQSRNIFSIGPMAHSNAITTFDSRYVKALKDVQKAFKDDKVFFKRAQHLAKYQIVAKQFEKFLKNKAAEESLKGGYPNPGVVNIDDPKYYKAINHEVKKTDFSGDIEKVHLAYWMINLYAEHLANSDNLASIGLAKDQFGAPIPTSNISHLMINLSEANKSINSPRKALSEKKFKKLSGILGEHGIGLGVRREFNKVMGAVITEVSLYSMENGMSRGFARYNPQDENPLASWEELRQSQDDFFQRRAEQMAATAMQR